MSRSGLFQPVGSVDEDVQRAVVYPVHYSHGTAPPLVDRLVSAVAAGVYQVNPVRLLPQIDRREAAQGRITCLLTYSVSGSS